MSSVNLQKPCKQRFKGVENFLRRVAFNLGNTASQTEVKIISCIPIDVTDLQQKIINLEKQLHETKQVAIAAPGSIGCSEKCNVVDKCGTEEKNINNDIKAAAMVNTALFRTPFGKEPEALFYYSDKYIEDMDANHVATYCDDCSSRGEKSNVSSILPGLSATKNDQACSFSSQEIFNATEDDKKFFAAERYINIFKKRKRRRTCKGKNKIKTELVYYAQNDHNNPFFISDIKVNHTLNKNTQAKHTISQIYLKNVMRRQYDPKFVIEEFSDTSQFSKPVCRDIDQHYCNRSCLYESDVCSCCHREFQNVDSYMEKHFEPLDGTVRDDGNLNRTYYDSNAYDVIPVKENAQETALLKDDLVSKKQHTKSVEIRCWPKFMRSKYRYTPVVVNYQTNRCNQKPQNRTSLQKSPQNGAKPQYKYINPQSQRQQVYKLNQSIGNGNSKSGCIDCGKIYAKHITSDKSHLRKHEAIKTILVKNAFVETDFNTKPLHNQSTQLELTPYENTTETTLNQIKSILQSVLTEVKTSTKVNNTERIQKKDAVVQKGISQNNMPGDSTFLHSFTYNNSYNTNPYLPSCSQVPAGQYCFNGVTYHSPRKCLQNFPVFIHPVTGKHMCECYYRKSLHKSLNKQATTVSTNTDKEIKKASGNETEKLIKEIYKSMALNMDPPTKDNSASEYNDLKLSENDLMGKSDPKGKKEDDRSTEIAVVSKHDIQVATLISSDNCKLEYTTASTETDNSAKDKKSHNYKTPFKDKANRDKIFHDFDNFSTATIIEDEEAMESSSESDNEEIVISKNYNLQPKKKKEGIFKRMLKSVKLLKKRKEADLKSESDEKSNDGDSSSGSISSGRSKKLPAQDGLKHPLEQNVNSNLKIFNLSNQNKIHERTRRLPYLEQEYRRQWNERLIFEKQQERNYSSQRSFSKKSNSYPRPTHLSMSYDARSSTIKQDPIRCEHLNQNLEEENRESVTNIGLNDKTKDELRWLKKCKFGINCRENWKKLIVEN